MDSLALHSKHYGQGPTEKMVLALPSLPLSDFRGEAQKCLLIASREGNYSRCYKESPIISELISGRDLQSMEFCGQSFE